MKEIKLILSILIITILSCRKAPMPDETDCIELSSEELSDSSGFPLFYISGKTYSDFSVNPNNANEIIYTDRQPTSLLHIVKYNMETKIKEVLFEGESGGEVRWGKKNWILLSIRDGALVNTWKIKSDGDSLTQLTFTGNSFNPRWNFSGDKFTANIAFQTPEAFGIYSEMGIPIDTVFAGIEGVGSWSNENYFVFADFEKLIYGELEAEIIDTIYISENQQADGIDWINEIEAIWTTEKGIFKTNFITKTTERLIETCNSRFYNRPIYSPSNNRVILNKIEKTREGNVGGRIESHLVSMRVDGTDEQTIEIEE